MPGGTFTRCPKCKRILIYGQACISECEYDPHTYIAPITDKNKKKKKKKK